MAELYIELQSEKQEPEAIPCCDDRPPEYEACQPDLVPSVIKNREKCGTSSRRLEKAMLELEELIRSIASQGPVGEDQYTQLANEYLTMGRLLDEGSSAAKDLGSVFQERSLNSRIYHVTSHPQ
ncbi:hypothetical protein N7466_002814 [Penicillium verhagenii]|uniref:uncharacterized protein n=1 Tax=Penicillium verhagenii TaxID=1562060 RepID=UPI002544FCEE|nr:uncharacterized protein N7466_002814 [Penicillium verhagenii]KAJ5939680.1 hypothetical protein N7466_002814 [Penicillium verhagenii]